MSTKRIAATLVALVALAAVGAVLVLHAGTALVISQPVDNPDAIVSLASHEWERLPETIALAMRYPEARILLTRPATVTELNCHDCANRVHLLVRAGVARRRIVVLAITGSGTYGEAETCRRYWATPAGAGIRRLLVVTSPYHTRRSLAVFDAAFRDTGVQVGIQPATATSPARPRRWWRSPYDRWYLRHEWAAVAYYGVRYGVWAWRPTQ